MLIYGINPVLEALRGGRARRVRVADREDRRVLEIVRLAERTGIPVERVPTDVLRHAAHGRAHQGVVAEVSGVQALDLGDLLAGASQPALFVVLDGIEDPRNLGAILRTCEAAGVDGVIRQSRHAAPLEGVATRASAGAIAHVRVAEVVNISRTLEDLKAAGIWTAGLAGDAEVAYDRVDFTVPMALVMGAEGGGLRRLVRERCDWVVRIPMRGQVGSLNVSVAAGIALFEVLRQRRLKGGGE